MRESAILQRVTRWSTQEAARREQMQYLVGLLTEQDVCLLLEVTEHTLQAWRQRSVGPCYIKLGKSVVYHITHIEAWMLANVVVTGGTDAASATAEI